MSLRSWIPAFLIQHVQRLIRLLCPEQVLWALCVYVEAVSVLPQLRMMQKAKVGQQPSQPLCAAHLFVGKGLLLLEAILQRHAQCCQVHDNVMLARLHPLGCY